MKKTQPYTLQYLNEWAKDAMEQGGPYPEPKLVATVEALEHAQYQLDAYRAMCVIQDKAIEVLKKELAKTKRKLGKYERKSRGTV
jgi:phage shock protein A